MTLVIFDLCDTLYAQNTTQAFLTLLGHENPRVARALRRWTGRSSPFFWFGAVMHRLGVDVARRQIVAALADVSQATLQRVAAAYVEGPLGQHRIAPIHEALHHHRSKGDRIYILSNSLDPVVQAVARSLGVEGQGSVLAFDGERCAGQLAKDLTGRKSHAAAALRQSGENLYVYTDNRTDRDLIAIADHATVVIPEGRKSDRWAGEECDYLEL